MISRAKVMISQAKVKILQANGEVYAEDGQVFSVRGGLESAIKIFPEDGREMGLLACKN